MPDTPAFPARHANGRFGPGNPGRRTGARNRISHRAAMAILQDFERNSGEVMERLRRVYTPAYFAILLRFLDRQLEVEPPSFDDVSDDEAALTLRLACAALNDTADPRAALLALDSALLSCASPEPAA